MRILYNLGIYLLALATFLRKKSRSTFLPKLGRGFPTIEKGDRPLIWVHAVSFGETKAVIPLVKKLKERPDQPLIVLSTITQTGHAEGQKNCPEADWHVYLPFDFPWLIGPFMRKVRPTLVLIEETDFWVNFQEAAKEAGATVILVNGKLSLRSMKRYAQIPRLTSLLLGCLDYLCVQGELYAERFASIGIPKNKIEVTGNIKLDGLLESLNVDALREKFGVTEGDLILTLGSTHDPEEKLLLEALKPLWQAFPSLKILLVPRHPGRFNEVEHLLKDSKLSYGLFSKGQSLKNNQVLLVDTMGRLRDCYAISTLAFVGGSFTPKVGGHNILEPAAFGVPVLFGPYMHSQPDFLNLVTTYGCGETVNADELTARFRALLADSITRAMMGKKGLQLIVESKGALERTLLAVNQRA